METPKPIRILGLSYAYHDAAAALLIDGRIVAAAQEERFTRKKHDASFPKNAIQYCLSAAGITIADITHIVFYDKPIAKFDRLLRTYIKVWPRGLASFMSAMSVWLKEKLWIESYVKRELGYTGPILFTEHHYSHAASAYYASDFDEAVVVTMDGVGEWDTTTIGYGKGNDLRLTKRIRFPHSLGLLYSAVTYYLGFKVNSAEYKVMGLAPYGKHPERYREAFKKLIQVNEDGSYKLDMRYFAYEYGKTMTNSAFDKLFGAPARSPESPLTDDHKDIAAALQEITEEIVLKIVRHAKELHPSDNLCLSGGVALNCVANGKIAQTGWFKKIYVQPASGDAGGALGAACYLYFDVLKQPKCSDVMPHVYVGPSFSDEEIRKFLATHPDARDCTSTHYTDEQLFTEVARRIAANEVIGYFRGRMEFGPRSLGARSILADPRHAENWQRVNLKIKFRESFRPFAPSILAEHAAEYFDLNGHESPFMLLVGSAKTDTVPAVTHVDSSARIQTVRADQNPDFHAILKAFHAQTGCPIVINTSFNVRGEPIVLSPADAFACFVNTDIDCLVLGNYVLSKKDNPQLAERRNASHLDAFALD